MATLSAQATSNQPLKYKTWVLKVSINCEGCKRKVKKILHKINGVYTISIDSQLQRVTVTGNVDIETLMKRLTKTGKHPELWPENLAGEEKILAGKSKNNGKENDPQSSKNTKNNNDNNNTKKMEDQAQLSTSTVMSEAEKSTENEESQRSKERESSPEKKSPVKMKKSQGQNGNCSSGTGSHTNQGVSVNHPYCNYCNYPHDFCYCYNIWPSSMVYANRSYTAPHPSKTPSQFCYAPPYWPYTCPRGYQEIYDHGSFEIFSDENANGCFIM